MLILRKATSRTLMLASAVLPCLLSSCAVLSVDVDVYKGPLMNEERVQMLQLISMGEGAKLLLVHLRDASEWKDSGGKKPDDITGYKPGYIKEPKYNMKVECSLREIVFTACKTGARGFRNPMAERVNEILGWYDKIPNSKSDEGLDEGLDSLASTYKSTLSKPKPTTQNEIGKQVSLNAQDKLMDGLAQFAVRILFLANHDGLLANPDSQGWISGGLVNLSRGLFGDSVTDVFSPMVYFDNFQGKGTLAARERLQYVRLLQAVGNSILLSVNELREQEAAGKGGDIRAKAEKAAIEAAFSGDPFRVYVNLTRELGEEKKGQVSLVIAESVG